MPWNNVKNKLKDLFNFYCCLPTLTLCDLPKGYGCYAHFLFTFLYQRQRQTCLAGRDEKCSRLSNKTSLVNVDRLCFLCGNWRLHFPYALLTSIDYYYWLGIYVLLLFSLPPLFKKYVLWYSLYSAFVATLPWSK